ncbi:MAG: amidohydrolase family protein [Pseudonocardiales bacterium]
MTSPLHLRGVLLPWDQQRDVWVVDGTLTFEPLGGAQTVAERGWILPGLVDAHSHIGLQEDGPVADLDVAREQARTDRDTGALLLRDAGSPLDTRPLLDEPDLPRLIRAGRHIARPRRYIRNYAAEVEPAGLVDEVLRQAEYGGGWVKVVGDWIDRDVGDLAPLWPDGVLAEAVRAAHAAGVRVAVHTFATETIPGLLAAGVDSIEHGTGLATDHLTEMAAKGITLTATSQIVGTFGQIAERAGPKFPAYAARMHAMAADYARVLRAAYQAGVVINVGSDSGGVLPHGQVVGEIRALHAAGLPREAALAAGSWAARDWLGLPGIEEGGPADLVVYPTDPRVDLDVLATPQHIILRGGVLPRL